MKKQLICICMAALLSLSLLTGCGAGTDTGVTAGTETKNVTVRLSEVTHSVFYAPQYVAMSQGFFADEGLDIELSNGGGADKVMTAVVSGGADIGLAGPESCIYIHAQGKDDLPVIFAQLTKRDGSFLVGRSDEAFDWNDLRGKTIIGGRKGGVPEMTLEYVLKQHGIVPQEDAVVDTSVQFYSRLQLSRRISYQRYDKPGRKGRFLRRRREAHNRVLKPRPRRSVQALRR